MEGQKDLYCNLSRKYLQDLCKKYGRPANKLNSEVATSLILYLEKKNLNSIIWKATGSDPLSVETPEPRTLRRISLSGGQQKDSRETMSSSGSGNNQCNIRNGQHDLQNCKDPATSDKASEDVGILSQFHRDSNSSADLEENTFSCAVRSSVQAPSPHFQFDVISEDGIPLFVDLSSSPSDWIESLKDGVHICSDTHKLESPNYHHEIGWRCCEQRKGSSHVDSFEEVDNGDVEEGSHPVTTGMGALPEFNELNGAEGFLSSPRCNPGNIAHRLGNLGEEQATTSSRPESDIEKHVCCAKFCIREGIMSADPNTDVVPQVEMCNNSRYSLSSFAKHSKMLESKIINVDGDICNHLSMQQKHAPPNPVVVCTGLSASPSREIRESSSNTFDQDRVGVCQDFACQPKKNGTDHCGMINSVTCTKMQAFELTDHTKSASPSGLINGHSSDPTDVNQDKVEIENKKASTSGEYDGKILEAQKHQASNQINGTSLSPLGNYESGDVNLRSSIETDYPFMLCSHKAAQQAVEICSSLDDVQRNEALLSSCSNSASPSFVAPEKNGAGHCTPPDSDDIDKDVQKSQSTSMEILGRVVAGDQRKKAECLDFRDSVADTWRKSSGSESSRDRKRKRQLNSTEGQSQSVKPDAQITRITRQFAAKIHDSRRRSSRLFTK